MVNVTMVKYCRKKEVGNCLYRGVLGKVVPDLNAVYRSFKIYKREPPPVQTFKGYSYKNVLKMRQHSLGYSQGPLTLSSGALLADSRLKSIKGTVSRDFRPSVFFLMKSSVQCP
jgi:hypothetical protein